MIQAVSRPLGAARSLVYSRRAFSATSIAAEFKRLPSFAEIKPARIEKYMTEESQDNETLEKIREVAPPSEPNFPAPKLIKSFLFGSQKSKQDLVDMEQSFSKVLMRGKYVHEIVTHKVKPGRAIEYHEIVSEIYPRIANDPKNELHLVGSWRAVVGDMDTYSEYKNSQLVS